MAAAAFEPDCGRSCSKIPRESVENLPYEAGRTDMGDDPAPARSGGNAEPVEKGSEMAETIHGEAAGTGSGKPGSNGIVVAAEE